MPQSIELELEKYPQLTQLPWLDVHAHLNFLEDDVETSIAKAKKAGVRRVITIGTEPGDLPVVLAIAQKHYPYVCCTLGIHPHEAHLYTREIEDFILKNATHPSVAALGEMGLDYFYKNSPPEVQKVAFEKQLALAEKLQLPVEIHTRDADEDTVEILKKFAGRLRGIIHCFTGSQWLADECLKLGYNISLSGIITFKNASSLRQIAESVPLDRLHVETDAPFLTPAPFRGVKNSPQYVVFTAQFVADLKKMSLADFSAQMIANARKMFPKLPLDDL
jgi:TatD DNase family protein